MIKVEEHLNFASVNAEEALDLLIDMESSKDPRMAAQARMLKRLVNAFDNEFEYCVEHEVSPMLIMHGAMAGMVSSCATVIASMKPEVKKRATEAVRAHLIEVWDHATTLILERDEAASQVRRQR